MHELVNISVLLYQLSAYLFSVSIYECYMSS